MIINLSSSYELVCATHWVESLQMFQCYFLGWDDFLAYSAPPGCRKLFYGIHIIECIFRWSWKYFYWWWGLPCLEKSYFWRNNLSLRKNLDRGPALLDNLWQLSWWSQNWVCSNICVLHVCHMILCQNQIIGFNVLINSSFRQLFYKNIFHGFKFRLNFWHW